jgi:hypothetical protein
MDPGAIRDQIDKILNSQSFATKGQLRKLLEILRTNMDSQAALTTELVITELWPTETRTKQAKDVATEMNRLRRAVDSYYSLEGESDRIVIYFPKRAPSGNGHQETQWMDSTVREGLEADTPVRLPSQTIAQAPQSLAQAGTPRGWKKTGLITAACLAMGIVACAFIFMTGGVHLQPQSARLDGTVLRIMDADGKELWSKNFPLGFGPAWYYEKENGPRIWFEDLEGEGHVSVLFAYSPAGPQGPHSSTLICYSDRGKEKWRWIPGRDLPELNGSPAVFLTTALGLLKATSKSPARIVVANVDPWWPSQVAILDTHGKTMSEYWHSGHLGDMMLADLDGDGREEIIATGVSNGYDHQATLVVLDPDRVSGASTEVRPEFQIHGMGGAQEKLRLLFPRSDFNRAALFTYNDAIGPEVQNGKLRLTVQECPAPKGCPVRYEFDRNFHLITVYTEGDEFRNAHDRFYAHGKDAHALDSEEEQAFLKVRCLVGCISEFLPLAQNYDPASAFEKGWTGHCNPNGVWSYGYSPNLRGPISLYDKIAQNGVNGPNAQYWLSSASHVDVSPAAEYNRGPAFNDGNVAFLENEFLLVAGTDGQYSDLIFTAPVSSEYSIAGNFRGAQYGVGTAVAIVANETVAFGSRVTSFGQLVPFNIRLNLSAGSKLVFSVGPGNGFQNTGLSAAITRACAPDDRPVSTPAGDIVCSGRPTGK